MVKQKKQRGVSLRGRSTSPEIEDFMKKYMISPDFQYREDDYPISHQSHTSHIAQDVSDDSSLDNDYDSRDERNDNDEA